MTKETIKTIILNSFAIALELLPCLLLARAAGRVWHRTWVARHGSCLTLDKKFASTQNKVDNIARKMKWDWKMKDKIDKTFRSVDLAIEWLQQLVSQLSNGLT
jgi:hypothetical protein